ncbi:hypothetical protein B0H14DRAFT_2265486, partial [Mycena olivaceomarginata]
WAATSKTFLVNTDFGEGWVALVDAWYTREEKAGFEGTQTLPARKRPREVKDWVSRTRNYTPSISDATALGEGWWSWWLDINPAWRGTSRPLLRNEGSWASMNLFGQNGFLNVLMVLKWWRDAMPKASPDWEEAISDVTWALKE